MVWERFLDRQMKTGFWSFFWVTTGLAALGLGLFLRKMDFQLTQTSEGPFVHIIASYMLRYYWIWMLLLIVIAMLYKEVCKDLLRKVVPAVVLSFFATTIVKNFFWLSGGNHDFVGFPSEGVAIVFAFSLSLSIVPKSLGWVNWAAMLFLGLFGWARLKIGVHSIPDLIAGLGIGLMTLAVLTLPKKGKTAMAFGLIRAFRKYELHMMRYKAPADFIKDELKRKGRLKVLDVGCGDGNLKYFCISGEIEMHGVDFNPRKLAECESLGYRVKSCDLESDSLPYTEDAFDVVVICHCLEHLMDPRIVLRESDRVLRKGGLMIIGIPNCRPGLDWMPRLRYKHYSQRRGRKKGAHCQFFTLMKLLNFLRQTLPGYIISDVRGFRVISGRDYLPLEDWHWFYKLSAWIGRQCPAITSEVNVVMRKEV